MFTIKPTIGRKVWFFVGDDHQEMNVESNDQPLDATVIFVHNDTHVNLFILDHMGHQHFASNVELVQPGEYAPTRGSYATWMDYQVDQARKNQVYEDTKVPRPRSNGDEVHEQD